MNKQNEIINLFYISHLKAKEISKQLNVSEAYVSKIIKKDYRYLKEKNVRKEISKLKRKVAQNNFAKKKRESKRIEDNYAAMQVQHAQASKELSKSSHLSNENYRKWNKSAYTYNSSKNRYEFDSKLGRSYDIPKFIKER